ncbi:MAG: DNA repair protein RecN (Recombination protein N) [Chlamydiales bacterium]|jgi:DNA repair protein RecN (Recombination protein N)
MLVNLSLLNIVLVEKADIPFEKGLNILSGETGAGKSAIMESLLLTMGKRADSGLLRYGSEKGSVEAAFSIDHLLEVLEILEEAGINHETGEYLIIRREISSSGKNRSFINNQLVQLPLLTRISSLLVDIVGQHSHQKLKSLSYHRNVLDQFGNLEKQTQKIAKKWAIISTLSKALKEIQEKESECLREIEVCRMELQEITDAALRHGEEEELFAEYSRLSHAEELALSTKDIYGGLAENKDAVIPRLTAYVSTFDKLTQMDSMLQELAEVLRNALLEVKEAAYTLRSYHSGIHQDPHRLSVINERLELINRLKRKYGSSVEDIQAYQEKVTMRLNTLLNSDAKIDSLKEELQAAEIECDSLCHKLTSERKKAAKKFEVAITNQIHLLNMSKAIFLVNVSKQDRNANGDDKVEFFLMPNTGEKCVSVRECASGGELSRTMLGLKTVLAEMDKIPTLFFDEIDANIGGETAAIVGGKLKEIGRNHQVLCITHLPQVAKGADHHLLIEKNEIDDRTVTEITPLSDQERQREMARMLGGKAFAGNTAEEFAEKIMVGKI